LERQTAELQRTDDYLAWIKAENRKLDKPRRAAIKKLDKAKDSVLLVVNRGLKEGGNGSNQRAPHAAVHLAATEKVASARARAARAADLGHCLQHWPGPPAPSPAIFYNAIKLARGDAAPTQPQTHLYLPEAEWENLITVVHGERNDGQFGQPGSADRPWPRGHAGRQSAHRPEKRWKAGGAGSPLPEACCASLAVRARTLSLTHSGPLCDSVLLGIDT